MVESSGLTFSDDGISLAAFGAESWSRRRAPGAPPGSITSARLRGSRIQISGDAVPVDETPTLPAVSVLSVALPRSTSFTYSLSEVPITSNRNAPLADDTCV